MQLMSFTECCWAALGVQLPVILSAYSLGRIIMEISGWMELLWLLWHVSLLKIKLAKHGLMVCWNIRLVKHGLMMRSAQSSACMAMSPYLHHTNGAAHLG